MRPIILCLLLVALGGCGATMGPEQQAECIRHCQQCVECIMEVAQPPQEEPEQPAPEDTQLDS